MQRITVRLCCVLLSCTLLSCQLTPTEKAPTTPAFDPQTFSGGSVYEILPGESYMDIFVYRAGALKNFGHNHIVTASNINGKVYLHPEFKKSGLTLELPVYDFEVDNSDKRKTAGEEFSSIPSAKDIKGTRDNMLGEHVLDAENFPLIRIVSTKITGTSSAAGISLRINIKGRDHDITVPVSITVKGNKMTVEGNAELSQSELGMTPFSILMGAIAISDRLNIRFHFAAGS